MKKTREEYNEYMRVYMLARYHRRRAEAVVKLGGKCANCSATSDLEIDHIDSKRKSFDVAKMHSASEEKWNAEIDKCQLLCTECHANKSIHDLGNKRALGTHGTVSSYRYCHCDLCRAAHNLACRDFKRKKRAVAKMNKATGSSDNADG